MIILSLGTNGDKCISFGNLCLAKTEAKTEAAHHEDPSTFLLHAGQLTTLNATACREAVAFDSPWQESFATGGDCNLMNWSDRGSLSIRNAHPFSPHSAGWSSL